MKNLLIVLLIVLISGCHTSKKIGKSDIKTDKATETKQVTESNEKQNIDFNKNSELETTNINIKFSPPDQNVPSTKPIKTGNPEVDDQLKNQNLGNHGPVESITITTTKKRDTDKSKVQTVKEDHSATTIKAEEQTDENTVVKETTKPDRRWMWLLIIPAGAVAFLIYKNWAWIKLVLSPLLKFLKI